MQELRDLAQTPLIAGFVAEMPFRVPPRYLADLVQGVNLDIDPYWLRLFRANYAAYSESAGATYSFRMRRMVGNRALDWNWRPKSWEQHCRSKGYPKDAHPVRITVLLRVQPPGNYLAEAPGSVGPHPIRFEVRDMCVAQSGVVLQPGDAIGQISASPIQGTLGGFLRNPYSGEYYGVSCGHVCGPNGNQIFLPPLTANSPAAVGTVQHYSLPPVTSQANPKCNRVRQPVPATDMALVYVNQGVTVRNVLPQGGSIHRMTPIADMTSDDPVVFEGAHSGHVEAKIGGLNVWREIEIGGVKHCVGDLFTIEPRDNWYVKPKLSKPGDSGSWVINESGGIVGWDGMLIGGDGAQSYCCFAELVLAECQTQYPHLVLP